MTKAAGGGLSATLTKEVGKRNLGMLISLGTSVLIFVLSLPFVNWIKIAYIRGFLEKYSISLSNTPVYPGYSTLGFLGFIQKTKVGILGFPAFLLFIASMAALVLHLIYIVNVIIAKPKKSNGLLGIYSYGKASNYLSFLASVGTIIYIYFYANAKTFPGTFKASFAVFAVAVLSVAGIIVVKSLEKVELKKYHDHGFLEELRRNWLLFVFLIPCFVYFLINNYLPMSGIYFAFTQFNFRDGLFSSPFVGFKNFEFLVKANLWPLTRNTILYNIVFIGLGNVLQIFFAILVSQVGMKWFKKTSQTMIFMPYFVSYVILRVLVYSLLEDRIGLLDNALGTLLGKDVDFYNTPRYWPGLIIFFSMWKGIGYGMVVYLATIMGISDEYYEAAKIDGANIFQQIRFITVPLLKPTFIILLLYAIGGIMRGQFELFYQMVGNNGVLFDLTDIIDTYVYRVTTTQALSMGLATAAGLYQSVFGLVIVVTTNWIIKRKNAEYALF